MAREAVETCSLFKALFNNVGVGLAIQNSDGFPVKVNVKYCSLLGYSEEELLKIPFQDFTHPEDLEKDMLHFRKLLAGEIDSYETEKRYIRKNGTSFWALLTVSVVKLDDETITFIVVVQDIDSRKNIEAALRKQDEQLQLHNVYKDRLFSVIAHDLKGAIGASPGLLDYIDEHSSDMTKAEITELITVLARNTTKTTELLQNLLTWSRAQFKEITFQPASLSLYRVASKVTDQMQPQALIKGITIQVQISTKVKVFADDQMLHIVLRNLLSNAIKFSGKGKTIILGATTDATTALVSVTDEGVGLSDMTISKLLNRNMEGISTFGTHGEKGTGLGINLCMDYIELNGGNLQISSEVGKGSKFSFSLPLAKSEFNFTFNTLT